MYEARQRREGGALFALAVFGWSFPGVFVRHLPHLPPLELVGLRLTVAFFCLLPLLTVRSVRVSAARAVMSWRCWLVSLGMLTYYAAATPAFLYAPVGEVALIIASAPLFAVILRLLLRRPVTAREMAGALLAVGGVVAMAAPSLTHRRPSGNAEWVGIVLAVGAASASACYALGNRYLVNRGQSPGAIAQVVLTFFLGLPILVALGGVPHTVLLEPKMWFLLPLGALSTALPTVAVAASSHRMPPVAVTMINPLTAVCASVVATLTLGEVPTPWTLAGGTLVVAAVLVANFRTAPPQSGVEAVVVGDG